MVTAVVESKRERIIIIGSAGTGKTTLAKQISQKTGGNLISLDSIWQPHWTKENVPEFREILAEAHQAERWVSDGNYAAATFDIRLPRATLILWLEASKGTSILRAMQRVLKPGEHHRWQDLRKVIAFIRQFDRVNRPIIEASIAQHGPGIPLVKLHNPQEIEQFLQTL